MSRLFTDKIRDFNAKVNWGVFSLTCVFTLASWLDVNGVFWKRVLHKLECGSQCFYLTNRSRLPIPSHDSGAARGLEDSKHSQCHHSARPNWRSRFRHSAPLLSHARHLHTCNLCRPVHRAHSMHSSGVLLEQDSLCWFPKTKYCSVRSDICVLTAR